MKNEDLKSYIRIDYKNCGLEYDYTICPWHELSDNLSMVEAIMDSADEDDYAEFGKPEVTITPCFMTESDYKKWFRKCIEPTA